LKETNAALFDDLKELCSIERTPFIFKPIEMKITVGLG
jgi:hypothetical protein